MSKPQNRAERRDGTRARLLVDARKLFTQHGYDGTSIGMICRRARVTHGALYHHFPGKLELFEAVLEQVMLELVADLRQSTLGRSGWAKLEAACDAYLEQCTDPTVLAVLLRDGPRVVAPERFGQLDHDANAPFVVALLSEAMAEGLLRPLRVDLLARLLGAAFAEAGSAIAEAEDREQTRCEVRALLIDWLGALRAT